MKKTFVFIISAVFSLMLISQINANMQVPLIAYGGNGLLWDIVGKVNIDESTYEPNLLTVRIEIFKNSVIRYYDNGMLTRELSGWVLGKSYVHIAAKIDEIPQENGVLIPSKFQYSKAPDFTYEAKHKITKTWKAGTLIYIAVYTEISIPDDKYPIYESAWGSITNPPDRNTIIYIPYAMEYSVSEDGLKQVIGINNLTNNYYYIPSPCILNSSPPEALKREPVYSSKPQYGAIKLGNGQDTIITIAVDEPSGGVPKIYIDKNNDEDLTNDGNGTWDNDYLGNYINSAVVVKADYKISNIDQTMDYVFSVYRFKSMYRDRLFYYRDCYMEGNIQIANKLYRLAILDDNNDGLYDDFYNTSIYIDVDSDNKFNTDSDSHEYYANNKPFNIAGETYKITSISPNGKRINYGVSQIKVNPVPPLVPGYPAIDFSMNDITGKKISLKDYRGKVVMLDFCATWCGPCVAEMPNVKNVYAKYKDRGFEIIGISLDSDLNQLKSYVSSNGLTYPQLFDGKGWQNAIAVLYRAHSIPKIYLLDSEGIIRYKNVRGQDLDRAINELIKALNPSANPGTVFTRITDGDVVKDSSIDRSGSWGDYNNDGYVDIFTSNQNLYRNNGNGAFTKVVGTGIDANGAGTWVDYNNDGLLDLFVRNENGTNSLFSNKGNGTFSQIVAGAIVEDSEESWGSAWADYDNDGDLDLFVVKHSDGKGQKNSLYTNNGNGTFTKNTNAIISKDTANAVSCAWGDYDNDGYEDLFVINYGSSNFLYHNEGNGNFTKITSGEVFSDKWSTGCAWGDYNNDGYLDLFVTTLVENSLYTNNGNGTFSRMRNGDIVKDITNSRGCAWGDYDNDGDLDIIVTNGYPQFQNNSLYTNNGDGTFTKVYDDVIDSIRGVSSGACWADYDNDGDLDLLMTNKPENYLFRNNGNKNNWINIQCIGTVSNKFAVGTKVRIKVTIDGKTVWQMQEISTQTGAGQQNSLNVEFGLKDATVIDNILVEWPSGIRQELMSIPANRFITITESAKSANKKPMMIDIPEQLINEGVIFPSIRLDDYVSDPDNTDAEMTWTVKGNTKLIITIDTNRVTSIKISDPEWSGTESVTFTVKDPVGLSAEKVVRFTKITKYTISASSGLNGAILPNGAVNVNYGGSQTFTMTPIVGYEVADLLIDGKSVGTADKYTFNGNFDYSCKTLLQLS